MVTLSLARTFAPSVRRRAEPFGLGAPAFVIGHSALGAGCCTVCRMSNGNLDRAAARRRARKRSRKRSYLSPAGDMSSLDPGTRLEAPDKFLLSARRRLRDPSSTPSQRRASRVVLAIVFVPPILLLLALLLTQILA